MADLFPTLPFPPQLANLDRVGQRVFSAAERYLHFCIALNARSAIAD